MFGHISSFIFLLLPTFPMFHEHSHGCSRRLFQSLSSGGQADDLLFLTVDGVLHSVLVHIGVPDDLPAEATLHLPGEAQHLQADEHEADDNEGDRRGEETEKLTALPSITATQPGIDSSRHN